MAHATRHSFIEHTTTGAMGAVRLGSDRTHAVQFYDDDMYMVDSVGEYLASGLVIGQDVVAVVTAAHGDALRTDLERRGLDVERAMLRGQFAMLDADELLATFMVGERPDAVRFRASLEALLHGRGRSLHAPTVRVFGEMVDVLCRAGNHEGALALEWLWNELARTHRFSLLCAYSMRTFRDDAHASNVASLCEAHAHVIPTERFTRVDEEAQLREITMLQQRAQALASEVERSRELERSLRDALARAEAASRAKGEFLGMMSHELRTPLNAISGHVQLIELEVHGPINDRQRDALARVQRSQRRLLALINDVLNLARSDGARMEYDINVVPLEPLLSEVTSLLGPLFDAASLRCDVRLAEYEATLAARADREKVHQILLNLLGNALKFTPAGGSVSVHAVPSRRSPALIDIDVCDSGVGIATDKLEHIFEPFVQLGSLGDAHREGIGLGLSISRMLARGMGGDLRAMSMPGAGSTLTLTLPLA
jgi:signal transduction histidine kinase